MRDHLQPLIELGQGPDGIATLELGVLPLGHASGFICLLRIYFAVSYIDEMPSDVAAQASDDTVSRWVP